MLRLRQIALVARKLAPVVEELSEIFGLEVAHRDPAVAVFGLENAVFPVGQQFLEVVSPVRDGTAGGRYLERRNGDGGYMVILQCDDHPRRKRRADELGIRRALEQDTATYRLMQLHPRDTGGSFLEIDLQVGGEDMDAAWEPAGKDWQGAVRTEVVRAIAAAEIQSADPEALARRWSDILEIELGRDDEDRAQLMLANAAIRFVADRDGRGEGLGGLDLVAADRAALLGAAERRGRRISGDMVQVCGMRLRPVGSETSLGPVQDPFFRA
ncbi:MAG: VOC family protein [Candidatus Binatia bacterium]